MTLFVHFEATAGPEPYLLSIEAEAGPNSFKGLVRPPVSVQPPKGVTEQQLSRSGLEPRMVVPWLAKIPKGDGFKKSTLEEAAQIILAQNVKGLETVKALHAHKEIQTMLEVA